MLASVSVASSRARVCFTVPDAQRLFVGPRRDGVQPTLSARVLELEAQVLALTAELTALRAEHAAQSTALVLRSSQLEAECLESRALLLSAVCLRFLAISILERTA